MVNYKIKTFRFITCHKHHGSLRAYSAVKRMVAEFCTVLELTDFSNEKFIDMAFDL